MTFFYKVHKKISNQVLCPYADDIFIYIAGFCIKYMVVLISLHVQIYENNNYTIIYKIPVICILSQLTRSSLYKDISHIK